MPLQSKQWLHSRATTGTRNKSGQLQERLLFFAPAAIVDLAREWPRSISNSLLPESLRYHADKKTNLSPIVLCRLSRGSHVFFHGLRHEQFQHAHALLGTKLC